MLVVSVAWALSVAQLQAIFSGLHGLANTLRFRGAAWRETEGYHYKGSTHTHTWNPRRTCVPINTFSSWTSHTLLMSLFTLCCHMHWCLTYSFRTCQNTHKKTHTLLHFIGLATDKLSLKHIFFQNITSCSVQLRGVIITFVDVVELSASTIWIFWSTTLHPSSFTSTRYQRYSNEFQPSVWWRSLTLHWGCYGWVNVLSCLGRQTLGSLFFCILPFGGCFYPSCLSVLWAHAFLA